MTRSEFQKLFCSFFFISDNVTVEKINDVFVDDLVLKTAAPGQKIEGTKFIKNSVDFQARLKIPLSYCFQ